MLDWLQENYKDIIFIYTGLISIASVIVKFTPTIKDDNALLKVIKFVSTYLALNRSTKDSEIRKLSE